MAFAAALRREAKLDALMGVGLDIPEGFVRPGDSRGNACSHRSSKVRAWKILSDGFYKGRDFAGVQRGPVGSPGKWKAGSNDVASKSKDLSSDLPTICPERERPHLQLG